MKYHTALTTSIPEWIAMKRIENSMTMYDRHVLDPSMLEFPLIPSCQLQFALKCFHIKLAGCGKGHLDKISSHASMTTIGKASHSLLECQCVGTTVTYTVLKCAQKGKFQLASFFFFFLRRLLPEESDSDSLLDSCPSAQIVIWANRPNMCKQPGCIWHLQNGWKALEGRAALANSTYSSLGSVKKKQASTCYARRTPPIKHPLCWSIGFNQTGF